MSWLNTPSVRLVKRIAVAVIGGTILLIGVVMIVLPGPAIVVIPMGLALLATEFVWAKRWLAKAREWAERAKAKVTSTKDNNKPNDNT